MNEDNLTSENTESQSAFEGDVTNLGAGLFEGIFGEELDVQTSDEVTEETDEDDQVEEVSDEVIEEDDEPVEDASDDSNIEADEADKEAEADQEEFTGEIDSMSITELAEQVGQLEINGKLYTPAQLKSILGQEESAGTKAREASSKLKEIEAKQEAMAQQEQWLKERVNASQNVDQLSEIQVEYKKLTASLETSRSEGDMYEVAVIKDKMDVLGQQYNKAKAQVDTVRSQQDKQEETLAAQGLRDKGLGYLLEDTPQAKAWSDYASAHLTPQELFTATRTPAIAEAIEKARKFDAANGKVKGNKLKSSTKTLKSGTGTKIGSNQSKQESARKTRLKSGTGTSGDVQRASLNVANNILGF